MRCIATVRGPPRFRGTAHVTLVPETHADLVLTTREFIDYKTSMITDEDPLRGLLFY